MFIFAMGSNLIFGGNPPKVLVQHGIAALQRTEIGHHWRSSAIFRSPAFPAGAGPDFANAVLICDAPKVSAAEALARAHEVEASFGRERQTRWGTRTLDIDLIAAGGEVAPDLATARRWRDLPLDAQQKTAPEELILPHPRVADRSFVLVPLVDLEPEWTDPISGETSASLLAARPAAERASVVLW